MSLGSSRLSGWLSLSLAVLDLSGVLLQETEDVVEHKVTVGLLRKEESLRKLAPRLATVGHLANDLDDDAVVRGRLGVDRADEDLAVLKLERGNFVVDILKVA